MANFTAAILALVEERDRQFLLRVAEDYKLPFEELQAKYLDTAEKAIKVPRKYTKKVKSVETGEGPAPEATEVAKKAPEPKEPKAKQCCTAQTSKKEPCKFSALKGEVFCKRHLKQSLGEEEPKEPKAKKAPKPKEHKKAATQPMHTHPLSETGEACDLCESHGNALDQAEPDFEVVPHTGPVKTPTVAQRLAAMLEEADESGPEPESDGEAMVEDEYEEED